MLTDRLHDAEYINWVRVSLSLLYLKLGLICFCSQKANAFHNTVLERVKLKDQRAATCTCTKCTSKSAVKTKTRDKKITTWRMNCTQNICNVWLEEILPYHRNLPLPNIAWDNSNPQLWSSDSWEIVKLFQPYGCESQKKAEDCDCAGLLTMMLDCSYFRTFLPDTSLLQEVGWDLI